ncbi:hypothetical protein BST61_g7663 [Cercospora zeina]
MRAPLYATAYYHDIIHAFPSPATSCQTTYGLAPAPVDLQARSTSSRGETLQYPTQLEQYIYRTHGTNERATKQQQQQQQHKTTGHENWLGELQETTSY